MTGGTDCQSGYLISTQHCCMTERFILLWHQGSNSWLPRGLYYTYNWYLAILCDYLYNVNVLLQVFIYLENEVWQFQIQLSRASTIEEQVCQ
jgi:hypothetical protein